MSQLTEGTSRAGEERCWSLDAGFALQNPQGALRRLRRAHSLPPGGFPSVTASSRAHFAHIKKPQEVALPGGTVPAQGAHSLGFPFTGGGGPPSWSLCIRVTVAWSSPLKSDSEGHPEADEHGQPVPPLAGPSARGVQAVPPFAIGLSSPLELRRLGPPSSARAEQGCPH